MTPIGKERLIVLCVPVFAVGTPGPVDEWKMPAGVFGCGETVGFQPQTHSLTKNRMLTGHWIYPTEQQARMECAKLRAMYRRDAKRETP